MPTATGLSRTNDSPSCRSTRTRSTNISTVPAAESEHRVCVLMPAADWRRVVPVRFQRVLHQRSAEPVSAAGPASMCRTSNRFGAAFWNDHAAASGVCDACRFASCRTPPHICSVFQHSPHGRAIPPRLSRCRFNAAFLQPARHFADRQSVAADPFEDLPDDGSLLFNDSYAAVPLPSCFVI